MPLKLKKSLREKGEVRKALRRRITDEELRDFTEREVDQRIAGFLTDDRRETRPGLVPGNPIFSHTWREFTKDSKFYVGSLNGRLSTLEEEIRNTAKQSFGMLQDIQQEALALDSFLTEEEIKVLHNFSTVHYNAFVRTVDQQLGFNSLRWLRDYKTELPFLPNHKANIIPATGLTLPVRERVNVPIIDVQLVGEETDVGDSDKPIVSSSPRNLLRKNKVFRHVIIRREFDKTSRKYRKTSSRATLLMTLGNVQLVNNLQIKPVGQSTVWIDELSYINEAGQEIALSTDVIPADTSLRVLFEPVRTKHLKITFRQHAPVTSTNYQVKDMRAKHLNEVLRGVGFEQLLDESQEEMQGRVYDFSLEEISAGLFVYEPLGVFRSRPVAIESPLGLTISDRTEKINVTNNQRTYGTDFSLPDGTVLNEYYVGVTLRDANSNIALRDLIPVPDSYPTQREYLPLIGGESKLKLFPDMHWNLEKIQVASVDPVAAQKFATVTTSSAHRLDVGSTVEIQAIGPQGHPFNGVFSGEVTGDTTILLRLSEISTEYTITANDLPKSFIYLTDEDEQPDPLTVSREGTSLSIGTDYVVSIDGGITFVSDWPRGEEYRKALRLARSGRFVVKIINAQLDKLYWVQYRPKRTQYLGRTNLVQLKNGRVVFDKKLQGTVGNAHTVIVSRADSSSPYITPIIQFYALKVRENVS